MQTLQGPDVRPALLRLFICSSQALADNKVAGNHDMHELSVVNTPEKNTPGEGSARNSFLNVVPVKA